MKKSKPDPPIQSPIPFTHGSNGETAPRRTTELDRKAEALFFERVEENRKRLGVDRREFVQSTCGTALALSVINTVYGCSDEAAPPGRRDGGGLDASGGRDVPAGVDAARRDSGEVDTGNDAGVFDVDEDATLDAGVACEQLSGDEFIFDVQTHHVNPEGVWRSSNPGWGIFLATLPQAACGESDLPTCFNLEHYLREMFINSDTSVAVISAVPASAGETPLEVEEAAESRQVMNELSSSERLFIHGLVQPERGQVELDGMQRLSEDLTISAWKVYTQFGSGWRLDDPVIADPFIDRARSLGVDIICAHKGLPIANLGREFGSPEDFGPAAAKHPDIRFVAYHSGYEQSVTEGPYDAANPEGVDRLIKSALDNGIGAAGNIYAELGSTWRNVMTRPTEAAHLIGKLLLHLGEDRILWGTDSIWYGTPQDQIMAFRAFQIPASLRMMYGYPEITDQIRQKIFGLNAAALYGVDVAQMRCKIDEDDLATLAMQIGPDRTPTFRDYGPASRREFLAFLKSRGGRPG